MWDPKGLYYKRSLKRREISLLAEKGITRLFCKKYRTLLFCIGYYHWPPCWYRIASWFRTWTSASTLLVKLLPFLLASATESIEKHLYTPVIPIRRHPRVNIITVSNRDASLLDTVMYKNVPFGLKKVYETFLHAVSVVLLSVQWKFSLVFIEDTIALIPSIEDDLRHLVLFSRSCRPPNFRSLSILASYFLKRWNNLATSFSRTSPSFNHMRATLCGCFRCHRK